MSEAADINPLLYKRVTTEIAEKFSQNLLWTAQDACAYCAEYTNSLVYQCKWTPKRGPRYCVKYINVDGCDYEMHPHDVEAIFRDEYAKPAIAWCEQEPGEDMHWIMHFSRFWVSVAKASGWNLGWPYKSIRRMKLECEPENSLNITLTFERGVVLDVIINMDTWRVVNVNLVYYPARDERDETEYEQLTEEEVQGLLKKYAERISDVYAMNSDTSLSLEIVES